MNIFSSVCHQLGDNQAKQMFRKRSLEGAIELSRIQELKHSIDSAYSVEGWELVTIKCGICTCNDYKMQRQWNKDGAKYGG